MRRAVLPLAALLLAAPAAAEDAALTRARTLLKTAILVDGHNDLPSTWALAT